MVQADVDDGVLEGVPSEVQAELARLSAENKRLRETNEILRRASILRGGARPPRPLICAFIDTLVSDGFAVETICTVLTAEGCQVAARTYRSWKQQGQQPAARTVSDAVVIDALLATRGTPEGLYGRRKMTAHLRRVGRQRQVVALEQVSHHTVDRLMRDLGLSGVRHGKKLRTRSPIRRRRPGRPTGSSATSPPQHQISGGSPTSPTSAPGPASCSLRSWSTSTPSGSWAGTPRPRARPNWS